MLYTHKTTLYAHIAAVYPHKNDVIYTNTQGCILHLHKASPNIFTQRRHKHTGTSFICQHNASLYSCHNDALYIQRRTPFTHDTIYIKHSTALYTQNNDAVCTQNDVLCTQRRPIHSYNDALNTQGRLLHFSITLSDTGVTTTPYIYTRGHCLHTTPFT